MGEKSPFTEDELQPLDDEYQDKQALAFQPALKLVHCGNVPIRYQVFMPNLQVGICTECDTLYARINPETSRIERIENEVEFFKDPKAGLAEYPEEFQPLNVRKA